MEGRATRAMGNGTRFECEKSRIFAGANVQNRCPVASAYILPWPTQERVMSNSSIERKTVSLPKTVKTVENGCSPIVTRETSTCAPG